MYKIKKTNIWGLIDVDHIFFLGNLWGNIFFHEEHFLLLLFI